MLCAELLFITEIILATTAYSHLPILHVRCKKELMEMAIDNFKVPYTITDVRGDLVEIRKN